MNRDISLLHEQHESSEDERGPEGHGGVASLTVDADLHFRASPHMTLGVEVELQLLDRRTLELRSASPEILARLDETELVVPELFQSMIEVKTGICSRSSDAAASLAGSLADLQQAAEVCGVRVAAGGTHPFAKCADAKLYPSPRHRLLLERHRGLLPRVLVFGMHVHIGMPSGDHAIAVSNAVSWWIPHLLALSASSPYLEGADTGFASSRASAFESIANAGQPCTFESWEGFSDFARAAKRAGAITHLKDLWWDVRPRPDFGTIEIRICDAPPSLKDAVSIAAFIHCLCGWLGRRAEEGRTSDPPPSWIARENKWRASRAGLDAELVVDGHGRTEPMRHQLGRLLSRLEDDATALECTAEMAHLGRMLDQMGNCDRQRRVFARSRSLTSVAAWMVDRLRER